MFSQETRNTSSLIFKIVIVAAMYLVIDIWKGDIKKQDAKAGAKKIGEAKIKSMHLNLS